MSFTLKFRNTQINEVINCRHFYMFNQLLPQTHYYLLFTLELFVELLELLFPHLKNIYVFIHCEV